MERVMNRWVVVLLVLLAVIVLVSPGIVGRLAERNLQTSVDWAEREGEGIVVTELRFDRRWFTSEGRYRVEFRNGTFQAGVVGATAPQGRDAAALIVTTHIDHGLIPVSSMTRDAGSLKPGLASAVSTLQFDPGTGVLADIPGKVLSQVGLSGETVSQVLLDAGSFDNASLRAAWGGAEVTVTTDPSDLSIRFEGELEPVALGTEDRQFELGKTQCQGDQAPSGYGFRVGTFKCEVLAIAFGEPGLAGPGIGKLRLRADSAIDSDRLNVRTVMNVDDIAVPGFGDVDLVLDVAVDRLDARSAREITRALHNLPGPDEGEAAFLALYPRIEPAMRRLLALGTEIRVDRFDFVVPQGTVTSRARFDFPETDPVSSSWPALLLALTASADVRLPAGLVEMARAADPQASSLVALGFLKKDGDFYSLEAAYAQGLLTVNGAPLPIPLPGR
jgi:uncharacterized protein YdgA (DUF945 family)